MTSTGLREQLQTIYEQAGELTPSNIVEAATPKGHPLHAYFEWDDKIAGARYRMVQAEHLIRSVKVAFTDPRGKPQSVRWWHPVRADATSSYDPLDVISEDPIAMAVLINQAERDWKMMKQRYGHLQAFWETVRRDAAA